ncbi:putative solute:sodium symporter small subunit [Melghirimyces profundicolus]|uniref:Putative solute:sodium symporter small subunit n=1 Tax=Melghirimyces profundicolus TaxID=1242148 RepID=A0A2T6C7H6_9BACL|nr:sodium/substrate symporter small subunit [Melghirimyces profundicolus]PTX64278.1 putative solute:sodium symporter small subunit [Melghirimyces profundicolus]
MKKIDKSVADLYFRKKVRYTFLFLFIGFLASFGVVMFAEFLSGFTMNGMPFHYFMGAQGAASIFVILLFVNAVISDRLDREFGVDEETNRRISVGKTLDQ